MKILAGVIAALCTVTLAGCAAPAPTATVTVTASAAPVASDEPEATPSASATVSAAMKQKLFLQFVHAGDHPEIDAQSDSSLIMMAKDVCAGLDDGEEFNVAAVNAIFAKISDADSVALIAGAGVATFCPQYVPKS